MIFLRVFAPAIAIVLPEWHHPSNEKSEMRIYIDSACDILYSSFYLEGIFRCFSEAKITFENQPFSHFKFNNHFLALIIEEKLRSTKIIIDYADSSLTDALALSWSDFYFKVNIDENINYSTDKIRSIGPGFGIQIYSPAQTIFLALLNYLKSYKRIDNPKRFFSNYFAQQKRPQITDYQPEKSKKGYIYFVGSLWKKEINTNTFRANFIKVCLSSQVVFKGGFAPRSKNDIKGFEALTMPAREAITAYLAKQKQSMVSFNTPAVCDCHGWKLGEFLSLGKAIISTQITRKLPSPLVDHHHILITDGTLYDIKEKLRMLMNNDNLRMMLEKNARQYYEDYLSPEKVIEQVRMSHSMSQGADVVAQ